MPQNRYIAKVVSVSLLSILACACGFNGDTDLPNIDIDPITPDASTEPSTRVTDDLIVLYTFDTDIPGEVADVSGFGTPLDLAVDPGGQYQVTDDGWELTGDTLIRSKEPALKIVQECSQTNALSVEVWIRPASATQSGPARILGMSGNPDAANFNLLQGDNNGDPDSRFNARLRTSATMEKPDTAVTRRNVVTTDWTHVVFARDADETLSFYVNGQPEDLFERMDPAAFPGTLSNWDPSYTLNLGSELLAPAGTRHWHGEYGLLAIYRRDLSAAEVTQNFLAGR